MSNDQQSHLVVAALIRRGDEVLLVHQQGPDDPAPSWALPGGMVEKGELLTATLIREVREETGLEVLDPGILLYALQHDDPAAGEQATTFVFEVARWRGERRSADPDNLILEARFLPLAEALEKLESLPWRIMREPILACLRGEVGRGVVWLYRRAADGEEKLVGRVGG